MTERQVSDQVAQKIRELRKQRGWSTGDLALRCGLTVNQIENIESGHRDRGRRRRDITADELVAFGLAFNMPPGDLLPTRPIPESERKIEALQRDLTLYRAKLDEATNRVQESQMLHAELAERVARTEWEIEQLAARLT
jgi:transcriptional regulator with XRE-family HTH domain